MDQSIGSKKEIPSKVNKQLLTKGGHTEELVDHYWGSINYIFGLIRASEIKAGLILSFYGILLNFIHRNMEEVAALGATYQFMYILLGLWVSATIASIFFSIRCFMPRIEAKFDKNIFFFRDVITNYGDIKEFSKTFYKISLHGQIPSLIHKGYAVLTKF